MRRARDADALADLQKNYCSFPSWFLPPISLVRGMGTTEAFYLKAGAEVELSAVGM